MSDKEKNGSASSSDEEKKKSELDLASDPESDAWSGQESDEDNKKSKPKQKQKEETETVDRLHPGKPKRDSSRDKKPVDDITVNITASPSDKKAKSPGSGKATMNLIDKRNEEKKKDPYKATTERTNKGTDNLKLKVQNSGDVEEHKNHVISLTEISEGRGDEIELTDVLLRSGSCIPNVDLIKKMNLKELNYKEKFASEFPGTRAMFISLTAKCYLLPTVVSAAFWEKASVTIGSLKEIATYFTVPKEAREQIDKVSTSTTSNVRLNKLIVDKDVKILPQLLKKLEKKLNNEYPKVPNPTLPLLESDSNYGFQIKDMPLLVSEANILPVLADVFKCAIRLHVLVNREITTSEYYPFERSKCNFSPINILWVNWGTTYILYTEEDCKILNEKIMPMSATKKNEITEELKSSPSHSGRQCSQLSKEQFVTKLGSLFEEICVNYSRMGSGEVQVEKDVIAAMKSMPDNLDKELTNKIEEILGLCSTINKS